MGSHPPANSGVLSSQQAWLWTACSEFCQKLALIPKPALRQSLLRQPTQCPLPPILLPPSPAADTLLPTPHPVRSPLLQLSPAAEGCLHTHRPLEPHLDQLGPVAAVLRAARSPLQPTLGPCRLQRPAQRTAVGRSRRAGHRRPGGWLSRNCCRCWNRSVKQGVLHKHGRSVIPPAPSWGDLQTLRWIKANSVRRAAQMPCQEHNEACSPWNYRNAGSNYVGNHRASAVEYALRF